MKIELDGDTIRLDNKVIAFVRQNASYNDLSRLKEVFERANTVSPNGLARTKIQELQKRLEEIINEIGEIE